MAEAASPYRVAIVQSPPAYLDRAATLAKAVAKIEEAAGGGAKLVAFPEAWVPGYPEWTWRMRPWKDFGTARAIWVRFLAESVDLERDDLRVVRDAAKQHGVVVAMGINEREPSFSRSTIFNTLVVIGADGEVVLRHRKLVPTNAERMVWGPGDGVGLEAVETPSGRVAGLICWENYMPLARFALYASGVQLYLAPTWDEGETWLASMRHIAFEGTCWVLGCGNVVRAADMPADLPGRAELYPDADEWLNPGDSVIVAPGGSIVAGPLHEAEGILYADCDPERASLAGRTLDVAGHYGRPDVFHLTVDRSPRRPIDFGLTDAVPNLSDNALTVDQPHPNASLGPDPIRTISRDELQAKLERGDAFKLVMALNRWAFEAKHIPGSVHFDTPDELYAAVRPDDEVIVYCSNVDCLSSVALYRDLVRRGYRNVRRYSGGLLEWEDAGLPLEGAFVTR